MALRAPTDRGCCAFVKQQLDAEPASADELAQNHIRQWYILGGAARDVNPHIGAVIAEGHRFPLPSRIGGKDQYAIIFVERCLRIADEPVSIQIGNDCGMQSVCGNKFAQ